MGYPSEIPNAIPPPREPPRSGALGKLLDLLLAPWRAWRRARRRHRADAPEQFGQGVDPRLPPLTAKDRAKLDVDRLAEELERRS